MRNVFVMAANINSCMNYLREKGEYDVEYIYLSNEEQMRGLRSPEILLVDGYWKNPYYNDYFYRSLSLTLPNIKSVNGISYCINESPEGEFYKELTELFMNAIN
jgi:hypothetical protein